MTAYPITANHGHWWLASTRRLHAVPAATLTVALAEAAIDEGRWVLATWACARDGSLRSPHVDTIRTLPRCGRCCAALDISAGTGPPAYEAALAARGTALCPVPGKHLFLDCENAEEYIALRGFTRTEAYRCSCQVWHVCTKRPRMSGRDYRRMADAHARGAHELEPRRKCLACIRAGRGVGVQR